MKYSRHIPHLWEDKSLTFRDLYSILGKAASGALKGVEKVDGVNMMVGFCTRTVQPVYARNKKDLLSGGVHVREMMDRFAHVPPVQDSLLGAHRALIQTLGHLSLDDLVYFFGNRRSIFYNCEFIDPDNHNIVKYDVKMVIFHRDGHIENEHGILEHLNDEDEKIKALSDYLDDNQNVNNEKFGVQVKEYTMCPRILDNQMLNDTVTQIAQLVLKSGLTDNYTIGDYVASQFFPRISKVAMNLPLDAKLLISRKVMGEAGIKMKDITQWVPGKDAKRELKDFIKTCKVESKNYTRELELILHHFSVELLKNMESDYIIDEYREKERIQEQLVNALEQLEETDEKANAIIDQQLEKVGTLDSVDFCVEGFVFRWNNRMFKFTGNYAPVNRICGLLKYGGEAVAIFPGKFKPPHLGHFLGAQQLARIPGVKKVVILISPKDYEGITAKQSKKVWDIFAKSNKKWEVVIADEHSPVNATYEYVKQAKSKTKIIVSAGDKDGSARFTNLQDYANRVNKGVKIQIINGSQNEQGVNGSLMRTFLQMGDKKAFIEGLPLDIKDKDKEEIWKLMANFTKQQLNEIVKEEIERFVNEKDVRNEQDAQNEQFRPPQYDKFREVVNRIADETGKPVGQLVRAVAKGNPFVTQSFLKLGFSAHSAKESAMTYASELKRGKRIQKTAKDLDKSPLDQGHIDANKAAAKNFHVFMSMLKKNPRLDKAFRQIVDSLSSQELFKMWPKQFMSKVSEIEPEAFKGLDKMDFLNAYNGFRTVAIQNAEGGVNELASFQRSGEDLHQGKTAYVEPEEDDINEIVKHESGKYIVRSKKGKKLGTHSSKKDANAQLAAIHASEQSVNEADFERLRKLKDVEGEHPNVEKAFKDLERDSSSYLHKMARNFFPDLEWDSGELGLEGQWDERSSVETKIPLSSRISLNVFITVSVDESFYNLSIIRDGERVSGKRYEFGIDEFEDPTAIFQDLKSKLGNLLTQLKSKLGGSEQSVNEGSVQDFVKQTTGHEHAEDTKVTDIYEFNPLNKNAHLWLEQLLGHYTVGTWSAYQHTKGGVKLLEGSGTLQAQLVSDNGRFRLLITGDPQLEHEGNEIVLFDKTWRSIQSLDDLAKQITEHLKATDKKSWIEKLSANGSEDLNEFSGMGGGAMGGSVSTISKTSSDDKEDSGRHPRRRGVMNTRNKGVQHA